MDWSKAKTYLILTFLLLDLLLGYQYYSAQQQAEGYVQSFSSQLDELKVDLKDHHVILQAVVPKETPVMQFLQVRPPKTEVDKLVPQFLQNPQLIEDDKSKNTMKFRTNEGDFNSTGDGYFTMTYNPPMHIDPMSNNKISTSVMQLIGHTVWNSNQYQEDSAATTNSLVRYYQTYQKYPVFSASLEVRLQNSQIIGYNQKAIKIGSAEQNGQRVLPAITAIRSAVETIDPQSLPNPKDNVIVKSIELGYYSPNYQDADVWYLAPIWRIVTDRNIIYVNAFTGVVETNS